MMCGIADYTSFLTSVMPSDQWGVLSFCMEESEVPLTAGNKPVDGPVWHGIPGMREYSAEVILDGVNKLGLDRSESVIWFQHEFNIWQDSDAFVTMLERLDMPRIVTFHTLRFQSGETPFGFTREEYGLLQDLLPNVDAITVFSNGVCSAVYEAFPEYQDKVFILKHGVHWYPDVSRLSRQEAKEAFNTFLLDESDLDTETKEVLHKERIFLDPDTVVLGQTGFLHPIKGSEQIYKTGDSLQKLLPQRRIVAIRVGKPRLPEHVPHVNKIKKRQNNKDRFLFEIWLPGNMLPLAQRAFDVNYYWPKDCTQSGMLTHAFGAGAIVAGRELEGVGEMLQEAGALYDSDQARLTEKIRDLVLDPELQEEVQQRAVDYAGKLSWENQAGKHYRLAERFLATSHVRADK
ncbi:MAG TPA: hypothetical protein G4O07_05380 [Dehalococcoidia bacterium]|nr:hypothetical protein [Dehalococcoidia bacterium]